MTPKQKRDRLFKKGRPFIRPLEIYNGDQYSKDMGILWVAYKRRPFWLFREGMDQAEFAQSVEQVPDGVMLVVEDYNKGYRGIGPVAFIGFESDGWKVYPHIEFFEWATVFNKLRVSVSFFHWAKFSKEIGICIIHSLKKSLSLFEKCTEYGVLFRSGKLLGGSSDGDEIIFSIRGRKQYGRT